MPKAKKEDTNLVKKAVEEKKTTKKVENKETAKKTTTKKTTIKKEPVLEKKKSILYVTSEANPFQGTGGLADVMGSLPKYVSKNGKFEVSVCMPLYKDLNPVLRQALVFVTNFNVPLGWRNLYCGLFKYVYNGVTFYFLDNEYYFKRDGLYGHYDDGERFAFFSKAALVMMGNINYYPDVLHANDWQTALSVIYLKQVFKNQFGYDHIKAMFTIHNIEYQGKYGKEILGDIFGLSDDCMDVVEFDGAINLMKGAIVCADKVSTVSPRYALEITYDFFSHGLTSVTRMFGFKTIGILNGIDVDLYNPSNDTHLFKKFDENSLENKKVCKEELQKMLNLPVRDVPMISMISRLVEHKGIDLVKGVIDEILKEDIQFVILGKGDFEYEEFFKDVANRYPGKCRMLVQYNKDLSSKIYSGSDIFLMPSKQEPCGLSQMIACRYGTIPVVRKTGGLADSIIPYNRDKENGFGYNFENYNADEMLYVIKDAIFTFGNKEEWCTIVSRAMKQDFSWKKSALTYELIYNEMMSIN